MKTIRLNRFAANARDTVRSYVYVKKRGWVRKAVLALPAWLTPNFVTWTRLVMVLPLVLAALSGAYWQALAWFVLAGLLDALDGMIAEARDMKTTLGAFLDPVADKVMTLATICVFLPELSWPFLVIFAGDVFFAVATTAGRIIKLSRATSSQPANIMAVTASKVKFHLECYGCVVLLLSFALGMPELLWPSGILLAASIPFAFFSFKAQIPSFKK